MTQVDHFMVDNTLPYCVFEVDVIDRCSDTGAACMSLSWERRDYTKLRIFFTSFTHSLKSLNAPAAELFNFTEFYFIVYQNSLMSGR